MDQGFWINFWFQVPKIKFGTYKTTEKSSNSSSSILVMIFWTILVLPAYSLIIFIPFQVFLDHRPRDEVRQLVSARTNGATPLVLSCRNGHKDVVEYLVERCNADVEQAGIRIIVNLLWIIIKIRHSKTSLVDDSLACFGTLRDF